MVEELGIAKKIEKHQLSNADEILVALQSVLNQSHYRNRAVELSSMWQDYRQRMLSPKEEFTFWIETLLRHGKLSHLRIEDYNLPLWRYFSLDVIFFLLCVMTVKVAAMSWLLKKICSIKSGGEKIKKFKAQ